ncbi:hypothetical protein LX87_05674 [Larkinella arboricola]|uniref:Uncharacterized protein n=1 Tax=Larkinella arboricola TaxID=643671 RepID=A0A327WGD8_LARAB|nr:BfmA/BtgA family mobilization protein [Larkinella arboricola]RAJ89775.1 hypothetical protein LX87_05674 [Larkinella arboricola]
MSERKSLAVSVGTHQQLERLGAQFGLSNKDLVAAMVQYFTVTKTDPREPKADRPELAIKKLTDQVAALDKRFIGFIREQEKELLKPLRADVQALRQAQETRPPLGPEQLEEQLTGVVEAVQTLLRLSFRQALVDHFLRPEYRQQADDLLKQHPIR